MKIWVDDKRPFFSTGEFIVGWADWLLDQIPSYEGGRWYRHGHWGCRMELLGRYYRKFE